MSRIHGPKIVTDGLILYLDSTTEKSYPGTISYGPELVTNASVLTAGDGQVRTVSSIGGNYINFLNIAACLQKKSTFETKGPSLNIICLISTLLVCNCAEQKLKVSDLTKQVFSKHFVFLLTAKFGFETCQ